MQRLRVAVDVPAVSVEHVEIDEVHEAKPREVLIRIGERFGKTVGVSRRVGKLRHAASGKDIVNLADGNHVLARLDNRVEHRLFGRLDGKIMPSGRSGVGPLAGKGPGDDSAHAVLTHQKLSCDAAVFIQLLGRNHVLVRGNLEDGVGRSVDD